MASVARRVGISAREGNLSAHILDIGSRVEGAGPDQTVLSQVADRAALHRQVRGSEARDRFAEGDGHAGGVARFDAAARQRDGRCRAAGVDAVVGTVGDGAGIARLVGVGAGQADGVGGRFESRCGGEGGCPGDATVTGGHRAERAALHREIGIAKACDGFCERDGDHRGFSGLQGGLVDRDRRHRGFGVDGIRGGLRRSVPQIACEVGVSPSE